MGSADSKKERKAKKCPPRIPYEPPAIVYRGKITMRTGSGPGGAGPIEGAGQGVDPADLFGDD